MDKINICVFCGSSGGNDPAYALAAAELGSLLGQKKLGLVYGGGNNGLMGTLADACLSHGGEVSGIIPVKLKDLGFGHRGIQRLEVVQTMHERKARMAALSAAFLALPGGLGTLEELFEALAWSQLGLHEKPVGILNTGGYYDAMLEFLEKARIEGFIPRESRWLVGAEPGELLERLVAHVK